jgi:hypothetical protein
LEAHYSQPIAASGTVFVFALLYIMFFVGLFLGIAAAVLVVLFALGVISLRTFFLANPLPAAKKFVDPICRTGL